MKKKINKMMILIATVTILLTMVLITIVYYDLFRRRVLEDLKSYGSLLKSCSSVERDQGKRSAGWHRICD